MKDISLNYGIIRRLMGFWLIFSKVHENLIVLWIYQNDNLVSDRIDDSIKKIVFAQSK